MDHIELINDIKNNIPKAYMPSLNTILNGNDYWKENFIIYYHDKVMSIAKANEFNNYVILMPSPLSVLDEFLKTQDYNVEPKQCEELEMADDIQEGETFDDVGEVYEAVTQPTEEYEEDILEEPIEEPVEE